MGIKRWLGLDFVDLLIHVGVTICLLGFVGVSDGPDQLFPIIIGASFLVLGIRRRLALRRGVQEEMPDNERLAEVEDRVNYLEGLQDRVLELEERLDFAERLLATKEPERLPSER